MRIAVPDAVDYAPHVILGGIDLLVTQRGMVNRDGPHPCVPLPGIDDSVPSNGLQRQEFHLLDEGSVIRRYIAPI